MGRASDLRHVDRPITTQNGKSMLAGDASTLNTELYQVIFIFTGVVLGGCRWEFCIANNKLGI